MTELADSLRLVRDLKDAIENGCRPALFAPLDRDEEGNPTSWEPARLERPFREDAVSIVSGFLVMADRLTHLVHYLEDPAIAHRNITRLQIGRILGGRDPETGEPADEEVWTYTWPAKS